MSDFKVMMVVCGTILIILSFFLFGIALMGFRGELADASVAENRQIGYKIVALGTPLLLLGCWGVRTGLRSRASRE